MKRVVFRRCGDPLEVVQVEDAAEPPPPGAHEATVELEASPIHPADILSIRGLDAAPGEALPRVPGGEAVARVVAAGKLVRHLKPGDLTPVVIESSGAWQERQTLPAESLIALPPAGEIAQYAMGILNPAAALLLLREIVPLAMGEWVIQNAANSSVGCYLIQHARRLGIRTVNVIRRESAAALLHDLGADVVLVDGPRLAEQVRQATGGAPMRLALDAAGGETAPRLAACLSRGGILCNYGALSGDDPHISPVDLLAHGTAAQGFWLRLSASMATVAGREKLFGELIPLVSAGALRGRVEASYPLSRVREALAHAMRPGRNGKILLTR
ncbi:MAG: zinc-dependent alcohol dehydrogenase family protein [Bryobacteraceae bacterium]|nr:zinc-dependent alcohol dehydrogenase family protein [Bryobacteraceae bacterium]